MRIDHVMIGARDVGPVRDLLRERHGFGLVRGGRLHNGTTCWIVPFDTPDVQYLEVVVPHDEAVMEGRGLREAFMERTADGPAYLTWVVHVDDIQETAARIGKVLGDDPGLRHGESVRADGQRLPWAEAGFAAAWRQPSRPFFLEFGEQPARRSRVPRELAAAAHRRTPTAFSSITVGGFDDLADWLGGPGLPVEIDPSAPTGVREVTIAVRDGDAGRGEVTLTLP
ncbi:VOC family protein [Actinomadura graeca]|uniref:VOC family protein n=1 Tax=Actinomadura graeca TaxID=2750812 RepID=A0ABX8R4R1_9ACTN|nr:VOC family protein [Actinomadura graeca]QXJ24702.1 VOC family protein [Actinomadura graeca]